MKYFRVADQYIGAFDDGSLNLVPPGAVEVPSPPSDARAIWDGFQWVEPVPVIQKSDVILLAESLIAKGVITKTDLDVSMQEKIK